MKNQMICLGLILVCSICVYGDSTIDLPIFLIQTMKERSGAVIDLDISPECAGRLERFGNELFEDPALLNLLLYSGKGINELGSYSDCLKEKNSSYILMYVTGMSVFLNLGLCIPKECKVSDFDVVKPVLASTLTDLIAQMWPEGSPISAKLTSDNIHFKNSKQELEKETLFGAGFILTMLFLSLIGILLILGSLKFDYYSDEQKKKEALSSNLKLGGEEIMDLYNSGEGAALRAHSSPEEDDSPQKQGWFSKALKCFSLSHNFHKLLSDNPLEDNNLKILHGIKFIALAWIIMGHTFFFNGKVAAVVNLIAETDMLMEFSKAFIYNATLAVDVFFFVSGFLIGLILVHKHKHSLAKFNLVQIYVHRILRLYPLLILVILLYLFVMPTFGSGPIFFRLNQLVNEDCGKYWPFTLFFLNNFIPEGTDCLAWTWYVSMDMQFFIVAPLVIYVYLKNKKVGVIVNLILTISSIVTSIILSVAYKLSVVPMKYNDDFNNVFYKRPYNRINVFLMGILLSHQYLSYRDNEPGILTHLTDIVKEKKLIRYSFYIIGLGGMFLIMETMYWMNNNYLTLSVFQDTLYVALSRPGFVLCLALFIYPVMIGRGRFIRAFLGNKAFQVLGKLTYGTYLIHEVFMMFYSYNEFEGVYFDFTSIAFLFWGYLLLGTLSGLVLTLTFEYPCMGLEKEFVFPLFLKCKRKKKPIPQIIDEPEEKEYQYFSVDSVS